MLIACGDLDRDTPRSTFTPVVIATPAAAGGGLQSRIGGNFADTFNADANSVPRDPTPGDVPPLDPTADPVDN